MKTFFWSLYVYLIWFLLPFPNCWPRACSPPFENPAHSTECKPGGWVRTSNFLEKIGSFSSRLVHRSRAFSGAIMRPMATHRCLNKNCFKKYWRICLKIAKQSHRFTLHLNRLRSIKVAFPAKTDSTVFSQFLRSWAVRKPKEPALKAITGGILL